MGIVEAENKLKEVEELGKLSKKRFTKVLQGDFVCFNCNQNFATISNMRLHDMRYHSKVGIF